MKETRALVVVIVVNSPGGVFSRSKALCVRNSLK